jgi:hypothetical protein
MYVPDPFKDVIRPVTEVHPKLTHGPPPGPQNNRD